MRWKRDWKGLILTNAELVDAWRVFPRTFVCGYGLLVVHVSDWYMGLASPNNAQAVFASAVIGISGPILNWYMKTGRDWSARSERGDRDSWWSSSSGGRHDHRDVAPGEDCDDEGGGDAPRRRPADAADFPGERPARGGNG